MEMPLGQVMPELTKVTWSEPSRRERPMQGFCPHSLQKRYLAGGHTQHTISNMLLKKAHTNIHLKKSHTFTAFIEKHRHWHTVSIPLWIYLKWLQLNGHRSIPFSHTMHYVLALLFFRSMRAPDNIQGSSFVYAPKLCSKSAFIHYPSTPLYGFSEGVLSLFWWEKGCRLVRL